MQSQKNPGTSDKLDEKTVSSTQQSSDSVVPDNKYYIKVETIGDRTSPEDKKFFKHSFWSWAHGKITHLLVYTKHHKPLCIADSLIKEQVIELIGKPIDFSHVEARLEEERDRFYVYPNRDKTKCEFFVEDLKKLHEMREDPKTRHLFDFFNYTALHTRTDFILKTNKASNLVTLGLYTVNQTAAAVRSIWWESDKYRWSDGRCSKSRALYMQLLAGEKLSAFENDEKAMKDLVANIIKIQEKCDEENLNRARFFSEGFMLIAAEAEKAKTISPVGK